MSNKISRHACMLAIFAIAVTSTASLYAAEAKNDSEFYLRDEEFSLKKALRFKSEDGDFSLRLGGRLHADTAWFIDDDNNVLNSDSRDSEFRRARLFVSGKAFDDWRYRFEYDFAANNDFRIKSAWVGYNGFKAFSIRAGNVLEPFSLEGMTSSNNITFMERGLPKAFTQNYKMGALVNTYGHNWSAAVGLFDGNIRNGSKDGWAGVARVTAAAVRNKRRLMHVGAALEYREPDEVSFSTRPESNLASGLAGTGTLRNVDNTMTAGLEFAAVYNSFSLQSEYMQVSLERNNQRSDPGFSGWYVYGSWFLTGEYRRYNVKKGAFKQIRPKSKYGAWELAARYSKVDLEDKSITGGEESNITLGANWYLNRYVRFMANYVRVDADPDSRGNSQNPDIFQLRAQLVF
ncbi:Phosphate-specific outer membrane porin OprP; Pyrophosphate-specific outer membrane porin OprO [hydrothermal vent metagenome]|uniref:Phosphate-specific outer membrane porin OprP Pyrophosphate-specific outer membrane porin OprO n=1 Tax=hydrothermal vent metagenome TaxID=652676 RepID=A0A3B0YLI3_9ZZZZ